MSPASRSSRNARMSSRRAKGSCSGAEADSPPMPGTASKDVVMEGMIVHRGAWAAAIPLAIGPRTSSRRLARMTYGTQQARQDLLETVAEATDELGAALAAVGAAYDQLD